MTLKQNRDLDILKMCHHTKNEVATKSHLKDSLTWKITKIAVKVECHQLKLQQLLAFTEGHIPTKLHQFLISSF